ncbi:MAG: hypothetical protein K2J12_05915 [Muribaculaceae bacterium]|nr:hypothetical protein [Muribaculaceae bacterium]
MRKNVVYGWLFAAAFCLIPTIAMAHEVCRSSQAKVFKDITIVTAANNDLPSDAESKTVYLIVGTNAVVPKDAYYSPSEKRLYIKEKKHMMSYNVQENPQYGQDSAKGKYKYRASNYFFDL